MFFWLFALAVHAAPPPTDSAWRALLHFQGEQSSARPGPPFFLSPVGHEDAAAEWRETEKLLSTPDGPCRFPARALFFGRAPEGEGPWCDRWRAWRKAIAARGVELVFAAAYLNSPSSMYGHTLLKFPGRPGQEELLDYTLSYGADTAGAGGAAYVWRGLTGGFAGRFATAPFYLKVKEYNFVENRDFWVYPLRLSAEETERLVAHAWELRDVDFPYYFLRKNCSFYLLEFLEVARPGSNLTASFPLWAVPMDTIRRLGRDAWLERARLRPSREKWLRVRRAELSSAEATLVSELAEGKNPALPSGREARLLDAAYELWRYRYEGKNRETSLLSRRAAFPPAPGPVTPAESPPEEGHRTGRIGVSYGRADGGAFGEVSYRGTLHDLLSRPLGYEPSSELTLGDLRLRWQGEKFFLERFDALRIRSLAPRESWFPRTAWSFRLGWERAKEMECAAWRCGHGTVGGGGGWSFRLGPLLLFGLGETEAEVGGVFTPNYRWSVGPSAGIFSPLWPGARVLVEGEWRWRLLGEKRQKRLVRLGLGQDLGPNAELRIEAEINRGRREGMLKGLFYF